MIPWQLESSKSKKAVKNENVNEGEGERSVVGLERAVLLKQS